MSATMRFRAPLPALLLLLFTAPLGAQADTAARPSLPAAVAQPAGVVRPARTDTTTGRTRTTDQASSPGKVLARDVIAISAGAALIGAVAGGAFDDACFGGSSDAMAARGLVAGALVGVPVSHALRRSHRRPEARGWLSRVPTALKAAAVGGLIGAASGVPMGVAAGGLDSRCDRNVGRATLNGVGQMTAAGVAMGLVANVVLLM